MGAPLINQKRVIAIRKSGTDGRTCTKPLLYAFRYGSEMELTRHILWPSDPVTRESSNPETQLIRWPCSTPCLLTRCETRVFPVFEKMPKMQNVHLKCRNDKSHCQMSVVGLKLLDNELLLYLCLLKILWPDNTSSHISRHLEFIIHCVSKKQDTKLLPITSLNVNRFSKFFHWQTHW